MRNAFVDELLSQAEQDERIWLLSGDLGYSVLEPFAERFCDRFVNVGVAEQNMAGVAAGLAMSGNKVFIYSIANFSVMRCLEQIRNDICYHKADVVVVSVGGGFSYGTQGYTHHGLEDIGVMRAMPHMTVVAPGDPQEARALTRDLVACSGPAYLRLSKSGEPALSTGDKSTVALGRIRPLRSGDDLLIVGYGPLLKNALEVAEELGNYGLSAAVASVHTLNPLDTDFILEARARYRLVVTCEEHVAIGGIGESIASVFAAVPAPGAVLHALSVDSMSTLATIGTQEYLRQRQGLDVQGMLDHVLAAWKNLAS